MAMGKDGLLISRHQVSRAESCGLFSSYLAFPAYDTAHIIVALGTELGDVDGKHDRREHWQGDME